MKNLFCIRTKNNKFLNEYEGNYSEIDLFGYVCEMGVNVLMFDDEQLANDFVKFLNNTSVHCAGLGLKVAKLAFVGEEK